MAPKGVRHFFFLSFSIPPKNFQDLISVRIGVPSRRWESKIGLPQTSTIWGESDIIFDVREEVEVLEGMFEVQLSRGRIPANAFTFIT